MSISTSSDAGVEPVRAWLKSLPASDRKIIGEEIKLVQYGWPLGMPLARMMESDLWEIRVSLPGRIARVLFTLEGTTMVLLYGFIKKSAQTPLKDLHTAQRRMRQVVLIARGE